MSYNFGLRYYIDNSNEFLMQGYFDYDYATNLDKKISLIGHIFTFGGNAMSWKSLYYH